MSHRVVQAHKNWACRFGAAEQTSQSAGCVRQRNRSVIITESGA